MPRRDGALATDLFVLCPYCLIIGKAASMRDHFEDALALKSRTVSARVVSPRHSRLANLKARTPALPIREQVSAGNWLW